MKKILLLAVVLFCTAAFADHSWLTEMFGDKLIDSKGNTVLTTSLKSKIIGIYFSAHWCPPCKKFTPELVKFRDRAVADKSDFEIVFVSSDNSESDMMKYMTSTEMKWPALPYDSQYKNSLSRKFRIRGIPSLIIIAPDGELLTSRGREDVTKYPANAITIWKNKKGK